MVEGQEQHGARRRRARRAARAERPAGLEIEGPARLGQPPRGRRASSSGCRTASDHRRRRGRRPRRPGAPPAARTSVRSTSCRRHDSVERALSAARRARPRGAALAGTLYEALAGLELRRGTTAAPARTRAGRRPGSRPRERRGGRAPACSAASTTTRELARGVGASNSARSGSSTRRRRAQPRDDLRRQQRVAAEREEVVVAADRGRAPSDLGEDRRQHLLRRRSRGGRTEPAPARLPAAGAGSALRSTLPLGVERQRAERHERRRHHVLGQRAREASALTLAHRAAGAPAPRRPPAGRSPGASSRATTTASRTAGVRAQHRLDLAQLDAVAAHLDLVVDAAQELERARPAASAPGRPCGTAARRRSPTTGPARTLAPSAPARPGSRAPARPRRCTARPAPRSAPARPCPSST